MICHPAFPRSVTVRVVDPPETMFDSIANVGIKAERIQVITKQKITGKETIDATGLVVGGVYMANGLTTCELVEACRAAALSMLSCWLCCVFIGIACSALILGLRAAVIHRDISLPKWITTGPKQD